MKKNTNLNKNIADAWTYTDIHTHIIPGVDDGASNMHKAVEMAAMSYEEGIRTVIATPHYGKWNLGYNHKETVKIFNEMKKAVKSLYDDMNFYMGSEIYYSSGIVQDLKDGKVTTMAEADYILVEFAINEEYSKIYEGLRALIIEGYFPILAHAERYKCLQRNLKDTKALVESGAYIQVNGRSFLGKRFDKKTAYCKKLLKNRMVHFVASDCHDGKIRKPIMKTVVEKMLGIAEKEIVSEIVNTNVTKLINNEYI